MALRGKKVVVIGGSGLLGSEISRACAAAGSTLTIADVDNTKGEVLAKELSATFEHVDVGNYGSVEGFAKKVDIVDGVINAAYPRTAAFGKTFDESNIEDMLKNIDLHVGSCLSIAKAFGSRMRASHSGTIIFLGSIYGIVAPRFDIYQGTGSTMPAEYAAAKGAIIMLTKYFAALFGKDGVRVNAISPGGAYNNHDQTFAEAYGRYARFGTGMLSAEDVAGAAIFLLSDHSSKITGQNIIVDAGWTL